MIFMQYTYNGDSAIMLINTIEQTPNRQRNSVPSTSTNYCNAMANNVCAPGCSGRLECQLRQTNLIVTPFPAFPAPQEGIPFA